MAYATKLQVNNTTYDLRDVLAVHSAASIPSNPTSGDVILWTGTSGTYKRGGIYRYDGSAWEFVAMQGADLFHLKGTVATTNDLPTTNVEVGDVYLVGGASDADKSEYVCLTVTPSVTWERLGNVGEVDLTDYAKTENVDALIKEFTMTANSDGDDTFTLTIPTEFTNTESD